MKHTVIVCALLSGAAWLGAAGLRAGEDGDASDAAVRAAVQHYIDGAATGKAEEFNTAWDTENGHMKYVRPGPDGKDRVVVVPIAKAIESWCSAAPGESWGKITTVDVVDDKMARVTVEMLWQGTIYVDYLSLYKIDGEWKIINKMFVSRGKADS